MHQYQELLSLNVKHEYFADQPCPSIRISTDASTSKLLIRLGLRIRELSGQIIVYRDLGLTELQEQTLIQTGSPLVLWFRMDVIDSYFHSYTETGELYPAKVLLLSTENGAVENGQQNLSLDDTISDRDFVSLPPQNIGADIRDSGALKLADIVDERDRSKKTYGFIRVEIKNLEQRQYNARYASRRSYYRYFIVSSSPINMASLSVKDPEGQVEFGVAVERTLPDNRRAIEMTSKTPIKFYAQPPRANFELRFAQETGRVAEIRLPNANNQALKEDLVEGQVNWVSEIYVHV